MSRLIGLILAIGLALWALVYFDIIAFTPEGQQQLDEAREAVGNAVEDAGEAISGD